MTKWNRSWFGFFVLALCLVLVIGIAEALTASVRVDPVPWEPPAISTATVEVSAIRGWWQSLPTPPAWPTPRATEAKIEDTGPTGDRQK